MPTRSVLIAWLMAGVCTPAMAQDAAGTQASEPAPAVAVWSAATGDDWLDTWLADVNTYAGRYRGAFVDELVRYQGAPRAFVTELLDAGARPADVYLACATARALGRTCREVVGEWRRDPAAGWREVLARLDAGRGTETFARVRRGLVSSFDRWARPIRLDAALRRAFPDREG
ncbi:hypothetical protein LDO31_14320 [Luteimonas sp. XNQY3]|nr:hypothetical protein [Luteimonas sp. XNQY3]MCD9007391.1 hypothetical protein [Luteimonas sp. XNQY3]